VETVLDLPVRADCLERPLWRQACAGQEIQGFAGDFAWRLADARDLADSLKPRP
jgi:hypothetical protein